MFFRKTGERMSSIYWSPVSAIFNSNSPGTLISGSPGSGKALYKDTIIPTIDGNKTVEQLQIGDIIFDKKGKQTKVTTKYCPENAKRFYEMTLNDGTKIKSADCHLWEVIDLKKNRFQTITTEQMAETGVSSGHDYNYALLRPKACEYGEQLRYEPYFYGVWLCRGYNNQISILNKDIIAKLNRDYEYSSLSYKTTKSGLLLTVLNYDFTPDFDLDMCRTANIEDKKLFLAGCIDACCHINEKATFSFRNQDLRVVELVREVCCSLGYKCSSIDEKNTFAFYPFDKLDILTEIDTSKNKISRNAKFFVIDIKEIHGVYSDYYCIGVDSETHVFLCTESYVPTHNTFFLLNTLANCIALGQKIIAIDPKNDLVKLRALYDDSQLSIIDVNNIQEGALNPFTFLETCDVNTILSVIQAICGTLSDAAFDAITPIIQDFINDNRIYNKYTDMQTLADYLYASPSDEARFIAARLKAQQDTKYGKLLFTNNVNVEALNVSLDKSLIISLFGMPLPNHLKDAKDYSAEEKFTSAIIYIICKRLLEILQKGNKIPTTLVIDEAHIVWGTPEISQLIDTFLVLGRSLNVATVLASQGISHFPKPIANLVSSKFIFKSSQSEAEEYLKMFNTDKIDLDKALDEKPIISGITKLKQGHAFFMDRQGQSGFIRITSIYDPKIFNTNPLDNK